MTNLILVIIGAIGVMIMGVPVAFAFALAGFILCGIYGIGITGAISTSFNRLNMYSLMALPLFIILGTLMDKGGLARRLVNLVNALIGRRKGGLGVVLIITNTVFGAICGVATSALAAIGGMLIPEMEKKGYPRGYSTGLAVSSSVLSLLIPPSTSMIIFGVAGRVSIPLLFVATIVPGLILTVLLCIINSIMIKQIPTIQILPKVSNSEKRREILQASKEAMFILFMPILILVGIYGGIFTPTEAASIAVIYVCIIGFFVYKDLTFKILWNSTIKAGTLTGSIVIVFFFFFVLSRVLVLEHAPDLMLNFLFKISNNHYVLLFLLNIILLITGMLMDDCSALILAAIIYLPAAEALGIDPIQFGAICGVNLGMGLITPPVAPLLYMGGIVGGNLELKEYYRPALYSILFAYIPVTILTTYIPAISLTLPKLVMHMYK
ncbi:MAG: TRAP transporter large permease subunit [Actinomycetota bacterium]|nr:TRAP transporter large permease subunit [Actinomycetota bacterium]